MGCDIHTVFQTRKTENDTWLDIDPKRIEDMGWDEPRSYYLFSWLANTRNDGSVAPILFKQRYSLPEDFEFEDEYHPYNNGIVKQNEFDTKPVKWMGEHSYGWFMVDEILNEPLPKPQEEYTLQWFKDFIQKLKDEFGPNTRMVFGFDS